MATTSLPGLTLLQSRVLRKVVEWDRRFREAQTIPTAPAYDRFAPDTLRFSKRFGVHHDHMLRLLNGLQSSGLISKRRRLSAGVTGNGYDGSLHSSVAPTEKAIALVAAHPA